MKRYYLFMCLSATILLGGCNRFVQVVQLESNNALPNEQNLLIYENDTLRVVYDFYSVGGAITFRVFNKLNKPIYANWKESAFIMGTQFLPYWQDKYVTNGFYYDRWFEWSTSFRNGTITNQGNIFAVAKREDAISFIPPKTEMFQLEFVVSPNGNFYSMSQRAKGSNEQILDGKKKVGIQTSFSETNSPTRFRQYLTFSMNNDGSNPFFVENTFWVNKITQVKETLFFGYKLTWADYQNLNNVNVNLPGGRTKIRNSFLVRVPIDNAAQTPTATATRIPDMPSRQWKEIRTWRGVTNP